MRCPPAHKGLPVPQSYRSTELHRQSDRHSTENGAKIGFQVARAVLLLRRSARDGAEPESLLLEDGWPEHSQKPAAILSLHHRPCFRKQSPGRCWLVGTPRAGWL